MRIIPQLVKDLNGLSNALVQKISSLESAINLSKSIDMTEHYGQSALGSSGMVDLYDLTRNMQEKYPDLVSYINAVQNSIESAVIYSLNGDSRPNAKGISIYMPLLKNEYSNKAEIQLVDIDWMKLLYTQRLLIEGDKSPPLIKSIREQDSIKGNVYGSDIAGIFAQIITNSSNGYNLNYVQNIESSFIDNNGYFNYLDPQILELCNETDCIPTSMNLEINRDKKFVFIPIRLVDSDGGSVNKNVSLVYELEKDNKFAFLGVTPEINPSETIPKGKTGLYENDKIYLKALPAKASFQQVKNISGRGLTEISRYVEDGPLIVSNPEKIIPRYVNISSPFSISFTICDYSDNCDKTRWYTMNSLEQTMPTLLPGKELGYDVISKKYNATSESLPNYYTYMNPNFGFKVSYPSEWIRKVQNIHDFKDLSLVDPLAVEFTPPKFSGIAGSNYYPRFSILVTDWPFKEPPKSFFDYFRTSVSDSGITQAEHKKIAGYPGFKFVHEYVSEEEQYLGIAKEKRKEVIINVNMNGKMYFLSFGAYASQFDDYMPVIEKMIDSFGSYQMQDQTNGDYVERIPITSSPIVNGTLNRNVQDGTKLTENQDVTGNLRWSTYIDPKYGYSIDYPYNVGLGKPFSIENANPDLTGEMFLLDNSSAETPEAKEAVNVIVSVIGKNESDKIKKFIPEASF